MALQTLQTHDVDGDDWTAGEEVVAKAASAVPWLLDQAGRVDRDRTIPDDVAAALIETGIFRLAQPRRFGGMGASPSLMWRAVFEIARGCASCAWISGLTCANLLVVGRFSEAAQQEVFAPDSSPVVPLLTGGVGHDIKIETRDDGIMLSGKWRYASGIDLASWVGLLVNPAPTDGRAEPVLVLVPADAFTIDHDSWHVIGMRGTGSKNIVLESAFVPHHRMMDWAALQVGEKHASCPNDEPAYRFPLNALLAMSVIAPTLGVASAVAEEYAAIVSQRVQSNGQGKQVADRSSHVDLAAGIATMDMLRNVLVTEVEAIERKVERGQTLSLEDRALLRMKIAIAARKGLSVAQELFAGVGGSLLPEGTRIERQFRDLHAMSSHFLLQPDPIGEAYGRLLLGLDLPAGARL
ncbi:MAG: acyl-CoA dehydrogenase family protein [Hyphomicrobiales bacterium]